MSHSWFSRVSNEPHVKGCRKPVVSPILKLYVRRLHHFFQSLNPILPINTCQVACISVCGLVRINLPWIACSISMERLVGHFHELWLLCNLCQSCHGSVPAWDTYRRSYRNHIFQGSESGGWPTVSLLLGEVNFADFPRSRTIFHTRGHCLPGGGTDWVEGEFI